MDAQDDGRPPVRERRLEVGGAGPVRRPDLDEARAGSSDDLRDADATADLDQLAARDRDAMLAGQPDREHESRGVVDRDEGVLGAGQRDQMVLHGTEPGPAMPGVAVELEQRIGAGRTRRGLDGGLRPRCAAEVRVEDHAGRVEDRRQATLRRVREALEPRTDGSGEIVEGRRRLAGRQARSLVRDHVPRDRRDGVRREPHRRAAGGRPRAAVRRSGDAGDRSTLALRGGNAWESNPPRRAERRATGFEDQGTHRDPTAPIAMVALSSTP